MDSLVRTGVGFIITNDYQKAMLVFEKLKRSYSNNPLGSIYLAGVKIAFASDLSVQYDDDFILKRLDEAEELAEALYKADNRNVWNVYYLALAKGYRAYYSAINRDYHKALYHGLISYDYFVECLKSNSSFYESYLAIGSYKYYKSKSMESVSWLPFVSDEREEGRKLLEKAILRDSYNHYLGMNALIWIYIGEKNTNRAVELAESALNKYPNSRFFLRALARAYEDIDINKSLEILKEIFDTLKETKSLYNVNYVTLKHKMAMLNAKIGNKKEALELCAEILEKRNYTEWELNRLEKRLKRVEELKKELSKK